MTRRAQGLLAILLMLWAVGVGAVYRRSIPADEWARLIEAGNALAAERAVPATSPPGLSARAAYLLAFHHAQDAGDVPRMLAAAERLERLGELGAARWARYVAAEMSRSNGR